MIRRFLLAALTASVATIALCAPPLIRKEQIKPCADGETLVVSGTDWTCVAAGGIGATGPTGPSGPSGPVGGLTYAFSTTTTDADPGSGVFRYNHATPASVTQFYVDDLEATAAADVQAYLDTWDDSTTTAARGYVHVLAQSNAAFRQVYAITGASTDPGGYTKLAVTHVSGATLPTDAANYVLLFSRTGDAGTTGPTGPSGPSGPTGPGGAWTAGTNGLYYDGDGVIVGADAAFCAADGGAGDLRVADDLEVAGGIFYYCASLAMLSDTADAADNMSLTMSGGGGPVVARGAHIIAGGNEHATYPGKLLLTGGNLSTGTVAVVTANSGANVTVTAEDGGTDNTLTWDSSGFDFTGNSGDLLTVGSGLKSYFADWLGIGDTTAAGSACLDNDGADRIYHDTDCDGVKDVGEEYIDQADTVGATYWEDGTNGIFEDDEAVIVGADAAWETGFGAGASGDLKVEDMLELGSTLYFQVGGAEESVYIGAATADAADHASLWITPSTSATNDTARAAGIYLGGNEVAANGGKLALTGGNVASGSISLTTSHASAVVTLAQEDGGTDNTLTLSSDGFAFAGNSGDIVSVGAGLRPYVNDWLGIGATSPASAACIDNDGADRLYHDTDCDGVKDGGEEYIDQVGGGSNALLDGSAHTDTTASAVTRGDLIIGNSTPAWDDLAIGAAGTVLTSDGTDPAWSTRQPVHEALYRTTAETISAGTDPYTSSLTKTNLGTAFVNLGGQALITMDGYTTIRVVARVGNAGGQSGTVSVELFNFTNTTSLVTATTTSVGLTNISATAAVSLSGLKGIAARVKSSVSTDDPIFNYIAVELY